MSQTRFVACLASRQIRQIFRPGHGEELKKTGAGNLSTVFGEPDIEIEDSGGELCVILHGVDVYDPNTGEVRSDDTAQVALRMIDTAYDEVSFFVRHCYFTGGQDPYARLKRALRADIDEDAWQSLYRTRSRPFSRPHTGKIAVKVIKRLRRRGAEGLRRLTGAQRVLS
jgi:adenine-specific DNA-methyltransferase